MEKIIRALARDLKKRGKIDLSERFIDGTFVVAKKGARKSAIPKGASPFAGKSATSSGTLLTTATNSMRQNFGIDMISQHRKRTVGS